MAVLRTHWRPSPVDIAWVGEGWRNLVWDCHRAIAAQFTDYELLAIKQKWGALGYQTSLSTDVLRLTSTWSV